MNIDDFLDSAVSRLDKDTIDISNQDFSSIAPLPKTIIEDENLDDSQDHALEKEDESTSSSDVILEGSLKEDLPSSVKTPLSNQPIKRDSSVSPRTPSLKKSSLHKEVSKQNPLKLSKEDSLKNVVSQITVSLKNKNLSKASTLYKQLRKDYDDLPKNEFFLRKAYHSLLLDINEKIALLSDQLHEETILLIRTISSLMKKAELELSQKNASKVLLVLKDLQKTYLKIPVKDDPLTLKAKHDILHIWHSFQELRQELQEQVFAKKSFEIDSLFQKLEKELSLKNMLSSKQLIGYLEKEIDSLPDVSTHKKMDYQKKLTSYKYNVEVISQIESLQKELDSSIIAPTFKPIQSLKKTSSFDQVSSKQSSTEKPLFEKNAAVKVDVNDKTAVHSQPSLVSTDSIKDPLLKPRAKDAIDSTLKKLKLNKVKLAILHHDFKKARDLLLSIEQEFGSDSEISSLKILLARHAKHIKTFPLKPSTPTQDDSPSTNFSQKKNAIQNPSSVSTHSSSSIPSSKESDLNEESHYFALLKNKLEDTSTHKLSISEQDLKKIARKVVLAKHNYRKGAYHKVDSLLQEIFSIDPNNDDAKKILQLVKS